MCTLCIQLNGTQFQQTVCKWFDYYQRFHWHLSQLATNDGRHVNISLVTFLLKKLAETNCNKVRQLFSHYVQSFSHKFTTGQD